MVDLDELERLEREAAPAPWKTSLTEVASGDGEWEYRLIAERGRAAMPYSDFTLIAAARNALPDLIVELRTLRARVAEMERDLDACRVDHADEAYEQGRRDALRGVQGACWYLHGNLWLDRFPLPPSDERRAIAAIEIAMQAKAAEEAAMTPEDRRERGRR